MSSSLSGLHYYLSSQLHSLILQILLLCFSYWTLGHIEDRNPICLRYKMASFSLNLLRKTKPLPHPTTRGNDWEKCRKEQQIQLFLEYDKCKKNNKKKTTTNLCSFFCKPCLFNPYSLDVPTFKMRHFSVSYHLARLHWKKQ